MTKVILTLLLAAASNNVMAEWVKVTSSYSQESPESQIAYVDPATIHRD